MPENKRKSILIADTEPRVRQALRLLCEQALEMDVVGEARFITELFVLVEALQPDIVLLDWYLPGQRSITAELLSDLRALCPVTIIITGIHAEVRADALASGAAAFVHKGDTPDKLVEILNALH